MNTKFIPVTAFALMLFITASSKAYSLVECSQQTMEQGDQVYPPSMAMLEVLQRSGYLSLPETHRLLKQSNPSLYHLISPYYTVQRNKTSCSLATATMILNALNAWEQKQHLTKPATQNEILEMVNEEAWDIATSDDGPGVTLEQLANFMTKMFKVYKNENEVTTFLVLDFDDGIFLNQNDLQVGHISPVGGYDPKNRIVLILDVDREWTGPYWVTEDTFVKGLNTLDDTEGLKETTYRRYLRICMKRKE